MIKISVVIPTYNRWFLLKKCLVHLFEQDMNPAEFEIIIADDENSLSTKAMIAEVGEKHPRHRISYVNTGPLHGPAAARNCGWREALGAIVAFTDDDCRPQPDWLSKGMKAFAADVDAVWGKVEVPLRKSPTDYERNISGLTHGGFVTANCFCRRTVLQKIGGFDERFSKPWREDSDLYFTLLENGAKVQYMPEAVVVHPAYPAAFGKSIPMQINNFFEPLLFKKHAKLYRQHVNFPILKTFYGIVLCLALMLVGLALQLFDLLTLAVAGWLVLTGKFVAERLRHTSREPSHIWEMIVTSIAIPPLAIYWRAVGFYRWFFADAGRPQPVAVRAEYRVPHGMAYWDST